MNQDELNTIYLFLNAIEKEKNAQIFLTPVDHVGLNLFDYLTVITEPMDISTIRKKIEGNEYSSTEEVHKDIQLTWDNCKKYNIEGSDVFKMAQYCEKYTKRFFDKQSKLHQAKNSNEKSKKNGTNKASNRKNSNTEGNQIKEIGEVKEEGKKEEVMKLRDAHHCLNEDGELKGKEKENENDEKELNEAETSNGLSAYEKVMLSNRVKKLQNDGLASLVRLVQKECPTSINETNDIIEILLGSLDRKTYEQINRLIDTFLRVKETNAENLEQKRNKN